jgi:broad specificity phosphatase PhoE
MIVGMRHGRVWNPDGVIYARLPGFRLSDEGRRDAEGLARVLSHGTIGAVYASPLERAQQTASILARGQGLEVLTDDRLTEWSFWTTWQGMPWDRLRERDPELLDAFASDPHGVWPEEPLQVVGERILSWAEEADEANPGSLVIGVTHEAPLAAALLVGSGRSLSQYHWVRLPHLATIRLLPRPAEQVDLPGWVARC